MANTYPNRPYVPELTNVPISPAEENAHRTNSTKVVRFDSSYIKTIPGILKIVQLACNALGFICIKFATTFVASIFFNILYIAAIILTGILLLCYLLHIIEKYDKYPWYKIEFFYCAAVLGIYAICTIIAWTIGESIGYVVGFFGLCAMIAYGYDAYLKWTGWKRGLPPQ